MWRAVHDKGRILGNVLFHLQLVHLLNASSCAVFDFTERIFSVRVFFEPTSKDCPHAPKGRWSDFCHHQRYCSSTTCFIRITHWFYSHGTCSNNIHLSRWAFSHCDTVNLRLRPVLVLSARARFIMVCITSLGVSTHLRIRETALLNNFLFVPELSHDPWYTEFDWRWNEVTPTTTSGLVLTTNEEFKLYSLMHIWSRKLPQEIYCARDPF